MGEAFRFLPETASTMDVAAEIVRAGNPEGVQGVVAGAQSAGRGRHGRVWQTFDNRSLAVTYIFDFVGEHMALLVALGLLDFVQALVGADEPRAVRLKWPNDLLLDGAKAAGILVETVVRADGSRVALVGVGLNLCAPEEVPVGFEGAFVWPERHDTMGGDVLCEYAARLRTCIFHFIDLYRTYGWTPELHDRYTDACATLGQRIAWQNPTGGANADTLTGVARGLTLSGHLEMVADDGTVHVVYSGMITKPRTTA